MSSSLSSSPRPAAAAAIDDFVTVLPGAQETRPRRGILRYYGTTDFSEGLWAGVELVGEAGRNDGVVKGKHYFACVPGQGIFVRPQYVVPYPATEHTAPQASASSSSSLRGAHDAALEQRCAHTQDALAAAEQLVRQQTQQLSKAQEVELDLRVQLATLAQQLERAKADAPEHRDAIRSSASVPLVSTAVQTEATTNNQEEEEKKEGEEEQQQQLATQLDAAQAGESDEKAEKDEERRQLRELCELLEDELRQERSQSDELTRVLKAVTEEKAALAARMTEAQDTQAQAQQALQDSLDAARRKIFALEAEQSVHTQLQAHCDELYTQIDQLQAAQAAELQRVAARHAQELDAVRREKDEAVRQAATLQAELARVGEQLVQAGVGVTALCDPLSAKERTAYEATIADLQHAVFALQDDDASALQVWPACATLHTIGDGAVDGQAVLQELNAWSQGPAREAAQLAAELRAGVFRVHDFSTIDACRRSTRQMFGLSS